MGDDHAPEIAPNAERAPRSEQRYHTSDRSTTTSTPIPPCSVRGVPTPKSASMMIPRLHAAARIT